MESAAFTAWPLLRGWMSRNAKTFSLSNSLREGMSPGWCVNSSVRRPRKWRGGITLDDLTKDTCSHYEDSL